MHLIVAVVVPDCFLFFLQGLKTELVASQSQCDELIAKVEELSHSLEDKEQEVKIVEKKSSALVSVQTVQCALAGVK